MAFVAGKPDSVLLAVIGWFSARLVVEVTPVPDSETVVGLLLALLVTVRVPEAAPPAVGAKSTLTVHDPPAAMVEQLLVWAKPLLTETPETVAEELPELLIVTACVPLVVPTFCPPKESEVGEAPRIGFELFVTDIVMVCTISGTLELATFSRRSAPPFSASENCAPVSCTVAVAHVPVPGLVTDGPF